MPSSYSSSLRFNLQFTGENINLWGELLNSGVFTLADYAIAGWLSKAITGDTTLSTANGSTDEARAAMIKFTGSPSANATITIPSASKSYALLYNATNKALTITTGAGATVTIDSGDKMPVHCDGSGVHGITYGGLALKDYISAVSASAGAVPSPIGNAGKYLYSDGANVFWRQPASTELSDYNTAIKGFSIAVAVAL